MPARSALAAVLLGSLTLAPLAVAQAPPGTYAVVATQAELDDGGTLSGAVPSCLAPRTAASPVVFFDETSGALAAYAPDAAPGERTTIVVSAAVLDAAAGADIVTCRDAVLGRDVEDLYVAVSDATDADRVLRLDLAAGTALQLTDPTSSDDAGDGITGIAFVNTGLGDRVFLGRNRFFGAPEDGVYSLDDENPAQVPTVEVLDPDLDLVDVANMGNYVLLVSSEFGENGKDNVIFTIDDIRLNPTLVAALDPCRASGGAPPAFEDCTDGGLESVAIGQFFEEVVGGKPNIVDAYVHVLNNSFSGPQGEMVGSFFPFGSPPFFDQVTLTEAELVAATGVAGFTPTNPAGALAAPMFVEVDADPVLYLAGSGAFGGVPGIYSVVPDAVSGVDAEAAPGVASPRVAVQPNPARTTSTLTVTRAEASPVRVRVVDALGRAVLTVWDGFAPAELTVELDVSGWAPGLYLAVVDYGGSRVTRRLAVRSR